MAFARITPAPDRITGNFASDKSLAAFSIAPEPPAGLSKRTIGGSSISTICVQKSRGTFICAGAEPRTAFSITLLRISAIREGSRTSS